MTQTMFDRLYGESTSVAVKAPVQAFITANVPFPNNAPPTGLFPLPGGYTPREGDRILLGGQTNPAQNGIWNASALMWKYTGDWQGTRDVVDGTLVIIPEVNNQVNGLVLAQAQGTNPIVPGASAVTFSVPQLATNIYRQTDAEIAAGITPTNYSYPAFGQATASNLYRYGAACNAGAGNTDDVAALQAAYNALPATGGAIFLPAPTYLGAITQLYLGGNGTTPKPCRFVGAALVGVAGAPTSAIGIWGTLGVAVPFSSTIAAGVRSFTVANSFSIGQLLILSNFPTDGGGSDAFTPAAADIWGNQARTYSNVSTANLRQTRRKEMLFVQSASGSAFTTNSATLNAYNSTTQLQFQPVTPAGPVIFDIDMVSISCYSKYAVGNQWNGKMTYCGLANETCYGHIIRPVLWNGGDYDCRVDHWDSCRNFTVEGNYIGGVSGGDNGVVKVLGGHNFKIDVNVDGSGTNYHGVMTDTAFTQDWTGYSDQPCGNYKIRATCTGLTGEDIFCTAEPFAAQNGPAEVDSGTTTAATEQALVYLKGTTDISVQGSPAALRTDGCTGVDVQNNRLTSYFNTTMTDPRSGSIRSTTDVRGIYQTWTPTVAGQTTAGAGTYTVQTGYYVRNGNRCTGQAQVTWTAHTGSGNILVNLPFISSSAIQQPLSMGVCFGGSGGSLLAQPLSASTILNTAQAVIFNPTAAAQVTLPSAGTVQMFFDYLINNSTGV